MVAEWRLNDDGKGVFQSHFSHDSVTIQSTEWQAHFSDRSANFFFEKYIKITPNAAQTREVSIKGKYANHSTTGTVKTEDEYLVYM